MALCEHCEAELAGAAEHLPPPWFDHDGRRVAGRHVTPRLWAVLQIMYRRRGKVVSNNSLMTLLYGDKLDPPEPKIIDVWICKLRQAIAPTPYSIQTHWRTGYQFLEPADDAKGPTDPIVGDVEDDVPRPPRRGPEFPRGDKYGLTLLEVGQSRRIA